MIRFEDENNIRIFFDSENTTVDEIKEVYEANPFLHDFELVVFADNCENREYSFGEVIISGKMNILAYAVSGAHLDRAGSVNRNFSHNEGYEHVLRLLFLSGCKAYFIPCTAEKEASIDPVMYSYILYKYMAHLKNNNLLADVFSNYTEIMAAAGKLDEYNTFLNKFIAGDSYFWEIDRDTLPYFILPADDTCYGVIKDFSRSLSIALVDMGQAVIYEEKITDLATIVSQKLKGIIGIQSPAIMNPVFGKLDCPKFVFWTDNPLMFPDFFAAEDEGYYYLCLDANYRDNLKKYFGRKNTYFLPPAGHNNPDHANTKRDIDLSFVGSYKEPDYSVIKTDFEKKFYGHMLANPGMTFETALEKLGISQESVAATLKELEPVCITIINHFRKQILQVILDSGIELHVYGDSFKAFSGYNNIHIGELLTVKESLSVFARSKISLNIMTWHKNGFTERMANAMLSGAVCITEKSPYMEEFYGEDGAVVLYELDKINRIPDMIKEFLHNGEVRNRIANASYEKCKDTQLWKNRAETIERICKEYRQK